MKRWDKSTKEVECLPQILVAVRRKLVDLADSHPQKRYIEVGMLQVDTFIQHLFGKRTDKVLSNDTEFAFSPVRQRRACRLQISEADWTLDQIIISTGLKATSEQCRKHL